MTNQFDFDSNDSSDSLPKQSEHPNSKPQNPKNMNRLNANQQFSSSDDDEEIKPSKQKNANRLKHLHKDRERSDFDEDSEADSDEDRENHNSLVNQGPNAIDQRKSKKFPLRRYDSDSSDSNQEAQAIFSSTNTKGTVNKRTSSTKVAPKEMLEMHFFPTYGTGDNLIGIRPKQNSYPRDNPILDGNFDDITHGSHNVALNDEESEKSGSRKHMMTPDSWSFPLNYVPYPDDNDQLLHDYDEKYSCDFLIQRILNNPASRSSNDD